MSESLFIETMSRAISDYRQILKKYLTAEQRSAKISQLRLKDPTIFNSEPILFQVAQEILADIDKNIRVPNEGYYSYYGIVRFAKFLGEYINDHVVDGKFVVHKAQKAANVLIKVIQLLNLPTERLTEEVAQQVIEMQALIFELASKEQITLYKNSLERFSEKNKVFYRKIVIDFQTRSGEILAAAA